MLKNKLKIDKSTRTILIILFAYLIIMLAIFLPMYLKKKYEKIYIVTDEYKIKYENGKWQRIKKTEDYVLKNFDIYENNNYLGNYKIFLSNKFTLLDENNKKISYSGEILGKRGNIKLKVLNYTSNNKLEEIDKSIVERALDKIDISSSEYNVSEKAIFDINNDGLEEKIYVVSNLFASGDSLDGINNIGEDEKYFSVIFMYKNDEVIIIDKSIDSSIIDMFEINNIFDIREDGTIELLYRKGSPQSYESRCPILYNMSKKKVIHNFCE